MVWGVTPIVKVLNLQSWITKVGEGLVERRKMFCTIEVGRGGAKYGEAGGKGESEVWMY